MTTFLRRVRPISFFYSAHYWNRTQVCLKIPTLKFFFFMLQFYQKVNEIPFIFCQKARCLLSNEAHNIHYIYIYLQYLYIRQFISHVKHTCIQTYTQFVVNIRLISCFQKEKKESHFLSFYNHCCQGQITDIKLSAASASWLLIHFCTVK